MDERVTSNDPAASPRLFAEEPVLCAGWLYLLGGILTGDGYGLQNPPDPDHEQPLLDFLREHLADTHPVWAYFHSSAPRNESPAPQRC